MRTLQRPPAAVSHGVHWAATGAIGRWPAQALKIINAATASITIGGIVRSRLRKHCIKDIPTTQDPSDSDDRRHSALEPVPSYY
jgi:hypothetical protein